MKFKVATGSLPQWDENHLLLPRRDSRQAQTFSTIASTSIAPFDKTAGTAARQRRANYLGTIQEHMDLLAEALRDYQSYHQVDEEADPWCVSFPNAVYLKEGDPIKNLATDEVYTVKEVLDEDFGTTRLEGNVAPKSYNRLRLDKENLIEFTHAFPRSFANSHGVDSTQELSDIPKTPNDSIRWTVTRSMQGTHRNNQPFSVRGLNTPNMETFRNPDNPDEYASIATSKFNTIIEFQMWTKTNSRSESLLNWFEQFMELSRWILELFGGSNIHYWERNQDREVYRFRNDMTFRSVDYLFIHERLHWQLHRPLRDVDLEIETATASQTLEVPTDDILTWPRQTVVDGATVSES